MDAEVVRRRLGLGDLVDLRTGETQFDDRDVPAEVLVELLTAPTDGATVQRRVQLAGARITGSMDLHTATLSRSLLLHQCVITEPIILRDADALALRFPGSHVRGIDATGMRCRSDLEMAGGFSANGEVRLVGAHIGGQLVCAGGTFRNPDGIALAADGLAVGQSMFCRAGFSARGEVRLSGAHIGGQLDCTGGTFRNPDGIALYADELEVERDMFCGAGFSAEGEVRLSGAHIGGVQLNCEGGTFHNPDGIALTAILLTVDGSMFCGAGFSAIGEVRLSGAHIGGQLDCAGGTFRNPDGIALFADGLDVEREMFCGAGFSAEGEVRLLGAHMGGQLTCTGGNFRNPGREALSADALTVDGSMFCRTGFSAEGEVSLLDAHIGGLFDCTGGSFRNPDGIALSADGLIVDRDMFCGAGFIALGQVRLPGAKIGGQLACTGGIFRNPDKLAVTLNRAAISGDIIMRPTALAGHLDMSFANVVAGWHDDARTWPASIALRGFTYGTINANPPISTTRRLEWLQRDVEGYLPQPYVQLANVCRSEGHDVAAHQVLIAQQKVRRASYPSRWRRWPATVWSYFLRFTIGYGYQPWRALLPATVLFLLGWWLFDLDYQRDLINPITDVMPAPAFSAPRYTADLMLPVANLGERAKFIADGDAAWHAFGFTLSGWLLAIVLVAGLTGIFKRD
jgi:hypothetical protein